MAGTHHGVRPVQPFRTDSALAKSRSTVRENGHVPEYHPAVARPRDTLAGHLTFALKHEGIHLEFLARLFEVVPAAQVEAWVAAEPTGQYARRTGFFYEFLTGRHLAFHLADEDRAAEVVAAVQAAFMPR